MRLVFACAAVILVSFPFAKTACSQVSATAARTMGMEIAWNSQVQLPRVGRGIVSAELWADDSQMRQFAIVELPQRTIRVSAAQRNRRGEPIGLEEAKRLAQEEAARLLGKNEGFQVVEASVPEIKLVIVTSDGLVQTFDAESGKLLWATPCGESNAPAHPAALSSHGIVLIHGMKLYVLDWETGKQRMVKNLRYATSNSVAVCGDIALITDFTGRIEAYALADEIRPWSYLIHGRAVGSPVSLADQNFCAIAVDRGYVYVFAGGEEPNVWLRYEASSEINGSLAAGNQAFYAGTAAGLLTKITLEDRLGRLQWQYRTGEIITKPALVVGEQVVVATESGDLFSIDDNTGLTAWMRPGLSLVQPIAQADNRIFCISEAGEIYALDAESGEVIGRSQPAGSRQPIVNTLNDRVYVLNDGGQLQCLRPIDAVLPTLIKPIVREATEDEQQRPDTSEQPATETSENPFNFGGAADAENPFGGGANPFGGSPAGGEEPTTEGDMEDPFGGGADPFGGAAEGDPFGNPFGTDN